MAAKKLKRHKVNRLDGKRQLISWISVRHGERRLEGITAVNVKYTLKMGVWKNACFCSKGEDNAYSSLVARDSSLVRHMGHETRDTSHGMRGTRCEMQD